MRCMKYLCKAYPVSKSIPLTIIKRDLQEYVDVKIFVTVRGEKIKQQQKAHYTLFRQERERTGGQKKVRKNVRRGLPFNFSTLLNKLKLK